MAPRTRSLAEQLKDAPLDDEPYTNVERKEDDEARASLERGEGVSSDELRRILGV